VLAYPPTEYVVQGIRGPIRFHLETGLIAFIVLVFVLGFFMSLGKAAVYKHIPVYYSGNVGAVGGLVGMIGHGGRPLAHHPQPRGRQGGGGTGRRIHRVDRVPEAVQLSAGGRLARGRGRASGARG
jgi:hypothetical protein